MDAFGVFLVSFFVKCNCHTSHIALACSSHFILLILFHFELRTIRISKSCLWLRHRKQQRDRLSDRRRIIIIIIVQLFLNMVTHTLTSSWFISNFLIAYFGFARFVCAFNWIRSRFSMLLYSFSPFYCYHQLNQMTKSLTFYFVPR